MEFLNNLAIPQSQHHLELLSYLLILTYIILMPYLALLLGSTFLSVLFNRKGRVYNNSIYIKFSKDLIDLVTINKSASFALGIIPMISVALGYTQLLSGSGTNVTENIIFSLILLIAALVTIYIYKYSFHMSFILNLVKLGSDSEDEIKKDFEVYKLKLNKLLVKSGPIGFIFLISAIYIFIGSVQIASNSARWETDVSISELILSTETLIAFLYFISASLVITSIGVLYVIFRPGSKYSLKENNYTKYVKDFSLKTALIFTLVLPMLYALGFMSIPKNALTYSLFGIVIFVLFFLLLLSGLLYTMLKDSNLKFRANAMFIVLILFTLLAIQEQTAFDTSSQLHAKTLVKNYNEYQIAFKESMGIEAVTISGEDIFKGRCAACHSFDNKIVGPPYKETLKKYEGDLESLVNFIYNPTKINPEYPPMPNQGLKKNEAEAIAEYIVNIYEQEYK